MRLAIWGTGRPRRDFIFSGEVAEACLFLMERYEGETPMNIGRNEHLSIAELAGLIREITGYPGAIDYDTSRPDGMPMKCLDAGPLLALGWRPGRSFAEGLKDTYEAFMRSVARPDG